MSQIRLCLLDPIDAKHITITSCLYDILSASYDIDIQRVDGFNLDKQLDIVIEKKFDAFINIAAFDGSEPDLALSITRALDSKGQRIIFRSPTSEEKSQWLIQSGVSQPNGRSQDNAGPRHFSLIATQIHGQDLLAGPIQYEISSEKAFQSRHPRDPLVRWPTDTKISQKPLADDSLSARISSSVRRLLRTHSLPKPSTVSRLDVTVDSSTFEPIAVTVSPSLYLCPDSHGLSDEPLVNSIPGSYESLVALLLSDLGIHVDRSRDRGETNRINFNELASSYNDLFDDMPQNQLLEQMAKEYSWTGHILDVGCGTGMFGRILKAYSPESVLEGLDAAESMVMSPDIAKYYQKPIRIGDMEKELLKIDPVDHIVSFSVFQYVDHVTFLSTVTQMFLVAKRSVSFDVVDISSEYLEMLAMGSEYERLLPVNNVPAIRRFHVPPGWKKVLETRTVAYIEPEFGKELFSYYFRFERI